MLSYFRWVLFFIALFVTLMGGSIYVGHVILTAQGPLEQTKNVVTLRGAGTGHDVQAAAGGGGHRPSAPVPSGADDRSLAQAHQGSEYEVRRLTDAGRGAAGQVRVQRRLTIPEGMTTPEVLELVRKTEALTGDVTLDVKEGDLLPETYFYSRDDTRDGAADAHEGGDGEDARRGLAQARGRAAACQQARGADPGVDGREGDGSAVRAQPGWQLVFINRLRRRMNRERSPPPSTA